MNLLLYLERSAWWNDLEHIYDRFCRCKLWPISSDVDIKFRKVGFAPVDFIVVIVVICSIARQFVERKPLFDEPGGKNCDATSGRYHEFENKTVDWKNIPHGMSYLPCKIQSIRIRHIYHLRFTEPKTFNNRDLSESSYHSQCKHLLLLSGMVRFGEVSCMAEPK